jgi:hypothetical protein
LFLVWVSFASNRNQFDNFDSQRVKLLLIHFENLDLLLIFQLFLRKLLDLEDSNHHVSEAKSLHFVHSIRRLSFVRLPVSFGEFLDDGDHFERKVDCLDDLQQPLSDDGII